MIELKDLFSTKTQNELLPTKDRRDRALGDLQALLAQPGWILLERILKIHIDTLGEIILSNDKLEPETENGLKQQRLYCKVFKEMPEKIVQDLMSENVTPLDNLREDDPFD